VHVDHETFFLTYVIKHFLTIFAGFIIALKLNQMSICKTWLILPLQKFVRSKRLWGHCCHRFFMQRAIAPHEVGDYDTRRGSPRQRVG